MSLAILVPAKVNSSRLPGKNWKEFSNGKNLTELAVKRSVESLIGEVFLITDAGSELINSCFHDVRNEFKIIEEPPDLAQRQRLGDVITYFIESRPEFDDIFITLPTSPIVTHEDMIDAWEFYNNLADLGTLMSVVSKTISVPMGISKDCLYPIGMEDWQESWSFVNESYRPLKYYTGCGVAWIANCKWFWEHKTQWIHRLVPWVVDSSMGIDIDTELDFILAREVYRKRRIS